MNDNVVHISNTPIFDQLAREMRYHTLVDGGGPTVRLSPADTPVTTWLAKPIPRENAGVKLTKKPNIYQTQSIQENVDAAVDHEMYEGSLTELKMEAIQDDIARRQLEYYKTLYPSGIHVAERIEGLGSSVIRPHLQIVDGTRQQTDEYVNAASTDAPNRPHSAPKPLWILEGDDADEE